ncbi:hypothetical protein BJ741DRAFT_685673 [Chytriomyces cf. hyalinus JEL632]|nr:hypothetical protein BJ741DRAFT_685673 [Chytriomyces cf. hyalinus JEL632]
MTFCLIKIHRVTRGTHSLKQHHFHNPGNGSGAQPRLLANLLATIKDERKLLKYPQPADPECLQIYSEAFVLSEIKRTYGATIEAQRLKINQLEPFRSKIYIVKYEAAQQLEQLRSEQESRIRQFQDACKSLERDKSALEAEILNLKGCAQSLAQELRERDLATSDEDALRKQVHELQKQMEISEAFMHEEMNIELLSNDIWVAKMVHDANPKNSNVWI